MPSICTKFIIPSKFNTSKKWYQLYIRPKACSYEIGKLEITIRETESYFKRSSYLSQLKQLKMSKNHLKFGFQERKNTFRP